MIVMSTDLKSSLPSVPVPRTVQVLAWLLGMAACMAGMLNLIAEWDSGLATTQFLILVIAPAVWMIERRRPKPASFARSPLTDQRLAWFFAGLIGLTSVMTSYLVGRSMLDLPPAYHDEYSYLFQARTLLMGRFSVPSPSMHAELFDQMHVLNEGRMASRYYPGTGLWLAPWVALGHPYWGQWLASSLASIFVFWTGYELGRLRVAVVSGLACALSPGIALFSNLLLAHQATLVGLSLFLWAFVKWQRTRSPYDAFVAGCGLSFAMICRPATAAGFGLPFGLASLAWLLITSRNDPLTSRRRIQTVLAMGIPLIAGWAVMLAYNQDVTGSWSKSHYQLYTDIYTPRHVYGFNNVLRGEKKVGSKVIDAYDRWAMNLTPELAATNLRDRWLTSWLWTLDLVPLLLCSVIVLGTLNRLDRRWALIGLAILSLHAIHVPYWYTGIMGWHYVFETAPLWCLLLGLTSDLLLRDWRADGRWLMSGWWWLLIVTSFCGDYLPVRSWFLPSSGVPRISNAIASIRYPRRKYAEFDRWLHGQIQEDSAVVFIESDPDDQHMDYVVNSPDFSGPLLRARYRRGVTDLDSLIDAFPGKAIYFCDPKRKLIKRLAGETGRNESRL